MSGNVKLLESFLNYCSDKSKVINQNIANANTENYTRKDVDFSKYLNNEMSAGIDSKKKVDLNDALINEDQPVTIEQEMAELAKNTINFKFASKKIGGYYKNIQSVIKSGGQ